MPIRSLTQRNIAPPRLGVIRKGELKQEKTSAEGKKYEVVGRDRDSFRVVFDPQYASFKSIFEDMYSATPVEFRNIMLLGDTPDTIFENWYEEHVSAKLLHRCDGEVQASHFVNGENVHDDAACENKKLHPNLSGKGCNCNERGWLRIVLMDFTIASGVWGYFQVETGSVYDIIALSTYLQFIDNIQSLRGLRFVLGRAPKEITVRDPKDPNKRSKRTMSLLYLMVEPEQTKQYLVEAVNQRDQMALSGRVNTETGEVLSSGAAALPARAGEKEMDWGTSRTDDPFVPPEYQFDTTDVLPMNDWDMAEVEEATSHLFDHPAHQQNALHKMQEDGELLPGMDTAQAVMAVVENRRNRRFEKVDDGTWWQDKEMVKAFCSAVQMVAPNMAASDIFKALNKAFPDKPKTAWGGFKGMTRNEAWARCLLYSTDDDDYAAAKAKANDPEIIAWLDDLFIQDLPPADTSGDIPF